VNLFTGYRVTDPTSGFFAVNRRLLEFYSTRTLPTIPRSTPTSSCTG
jgi:hypothetical protein